MQKTLTRQLFILFYFVSPKTLEMETWNCSAKMVVANLGTLTAQVHDSLKAHHHILFLIYLLPIDGTKVVGICLGVVSQLAQEVHLIKYVKVVAKWVRSIRYY